jgi:predicted secreted protein
MAEILITERRDAEVQASVGDSLVIRLQEAAGSGYSWTLTLEETSILARLGEEFNPPSSKIAGGAGMRTFRVGINSHGHASLLFKLVRPWSSAGPAFEEFRVDIVVS